MGQWVGSGHITKNQYVRHPRVRIVVSGNFDIFSYISTQLNEINGKKSKFLNFFAGTMRDQESFVDSARWPKSGVKWGVFIMCPFSSFNIFFSLIDCT